jgi:hypothetical protein
VSPSRLRSTVAPFSWYDKQLPRSLNPLTWTRVLDELRTLRDRTEFGDGDAAQGVGDLDARRLTRMNRSGLNELITPRTRPKSSMSI